MTAGLLSLRITSGQAVELSSARNYTRQIPARSPSRATTSRSCHSFRRGGVYPAMAVMTDRMTIVIKHEAVEDTGSFEVRFRPSKFFY